LKLSRVGIVGAGQLGRMMALAGYPLGIRCVFLDRSAASPAAQVAPILVGELEDADQLAALAACSDVVTFDWENISGKALAPLEKLTRVRPPRAALEVSQDRLAEKALFSRLRIPVAAHAAVDSEEQLAVTVRKIGLPGILKTRRLGYDGKGQFVLRDPRDIAAAWSAIGGTGMIYEKFQEFSREVSIVGARSAAGQTVFYPLSANSHGGGILHYSIAPFANPGLERSARIYLKRVMNALAYIGVLTIEFFVVNDRLVANEMAPRVHNSGHWTIDACATSQFEQLVRAICGLPLGSTERHADAVMKNLIGDEVETWRDAIVDPTARLHLYGKRTVFPGRKMGHVTRLKPRSRP